MTTGAGDRRSSDADERGDRAAREFDGD